VNHPDDIPKERVYTGTVALADEEALRNLDVLNRTPAADFGSVSEGLDNCGRYFSSDYHSADFVIRCANGDVLLEASDDPGRAVMATYVRPLPQ
jgi:hypothetical protein